MCGGKSLRTRHKPPGGAPTASHQPPTASPCRARGSSGRARAAQQRPRAPGGLRRALTHSTAIYMCLRPAYRAHLARRRRPSSTPALAPSRARGAHRLPSARCYPGPAGAGAGGDLSARRLTKAAAPAPSGRRSCRESPFARGRAQADRHRHLRRRSAILWSLQACPTA